MVSQTTEHLFLTSIIIGFQVESIMIIKVNFTLKYYYDHYVPDIQGSAAHCMDLAQKSQKIVSKSCFNYTFSMILTCEAVFVDNKSAVQVWIHLLGCQKQAIFCGISCLALPVSSYLVWFGKICLATGSTG